MEEPTVTWRIFVVYMFVLLFMLVCGTLSGQVTVAQYNAGWNSANDVEWLNKLSDCNVTKVDIVKKPKQQKKHKIVVVPTIIIFKDGEEVKRFQADISFSMKATRKELQDVINEQLMSDF
jgi:thiol-disulfide isomerase/thioredoxin